MENNKKNRKPLVALLLVAIIGIIGGTIAYFSSTEVIPNIFGPTKTAPKTEITETFTSPDPWDPGQFVEKTLDIVNYADFDVAARFKFTEEWEQATVAGGGTCPTPLGLTFQVDDPVNAGQKITKSAAQVDWANMDINNTTTSVSSPQTLTGMTGWTKNPGAERWTYHDGWYYYEKKLAASANGTDPGGSAKTPILGATLASDVPSEVGTTTTYEYCYVLPGADEKYTGDCVAGTTQNTPYSKAERDARYELDKARMRTKTTRISGTTGCGYDGAKYTLTLTVETIEYDYYTTYWTDQVTIS